jgi:glycerol-3-phosphate O-acyltransferase/dihydroxyacetone phosphate acyltransferase
VKVAGRDVLASWKVLISLGVAPVVYGFYAFLATAVAVRAGIPLKWRLSMPFLTLTVLPIMNYAALKFGEAGVDVLKWANLSSVISPGTHKFHRSLRPLIVALIPGQQRSLDKLKAMRLRLANEVAAVINEFGPKLYDDFDEARLFCHTARPEC